MRKINLKMNEFLSMPPQTNQIAEDTRAAGASKRVGIQQQGRGGQLRNTKKNSSHESKSATTKRKHLR